MCCLTTRFELCSHFVATFVLYLKDNGDNAAKHFAYFQILEKKEIQE